MFLAVSAYSAIAQEDNLNKPLYLDNGLKLVIEPLPGTGLVSFYVKIRTGSAVEGKYSGTGISHFVEHMIFKGSNEMGTRDLIDIVRDNAGHINATTTHDSTTYFATVSSEDIYETIDAFASAIMTPAFENSKVEKERSVIINEMRMGKDNPSRDISTMLYELSFQRSNYRFPIIGYESLFEQLTREDLAAYHADRYVPNNMVIAVSGDVDQSKIIEKIKSTFGKIQRGHPIIAVNQKEQEQIKKREYTRYKELNLGYMKMGFHTCPLFSDDIYALNVLSVILGQGDSSLLNDSIVKEKKLAYAVSARNSSLLYDGLFVFGVVFLPEYRDAIIQEISSIVEDVKRGNFDESVIAKAKEMTLTGYLDSQQTSSSRASQMAAGVMFFGDPDFARKYVEGIAKVTKEDIVRAAAEYLDFEKMSIATILPESLRLEDALSLKKKEASIEEKHTLENGLTLILKNRTVVPLVNIRFECLGGIDNERISNNGISNLMSGLLLKGTKYRTEQEISKALEEKGAFINSNSGLYDFGVSVICQKEDIAFCIEVMQDIILNSNFEKEEFEKAVEKVKGLIKRDNEDVLKVGYNAMKRGLFKGSSYAMPVIGTERSISNITQQQVKEFYEQKLIPENMVLTVVGDIDIDKTKMLLEKYFSKLPKREQSIPESVFKGDILKEQDLEIVMQKRSGAYIIGFHGVDVFDNDRYALDIILACMDDPGGRLFKALREDEPLTYSQGGASVNVPDDGFVYFYLISSGETLPLAKKILIEEISGIFKQPFTDREIEVAKKRLIFSRKKAMQINASQALTMSVDELLGFGYGYYKEYADKIDNVTKDQILEVAKKYIDLSKSFSVTVNPGEV